MRTILPSAETRHCYTLFTGLVVQGLVFRDCTWRAAASGNNFPNVRSKDALGNIEIDGLISENTHAPNTFVLVNSYGTGVYSRVKNLALKRIRTAPGTTVDGSVLGLNGTVDRLVADAWEMTFSGGAGDNHGVDFAGAGGVLASAAISRLNLTNPKTLISLKSNGATGSVICRATVSDSVITGCTHPVFVAGTRQAEVIFRGGSINTPTNLARVEGSTLTLGLEGTISSGVGANVITTTSTPTLRIPRSDRIALALNTLSLTPQDGDWVYSSATPSAVVSGSGAGIYVYRGGAGWVKLN